MLRGTGTLLGGVFLAFGAAAFASTPLTFTDIGTVQDSDGSSADSYAEAINASGQVAGFADVTPTGSGPMLPYARAFLYSGGPLVDLGGLYSASPSYAYMARGEGINSSGTVVGVASTADAEHAFVTSGGSMIDLGAINGAAGTLSEAYAANAGGTVVGYSYYSGASGAYGPFVNTYSGTYDEATGSYSGGTWSMLDLGGVLGASGAGKAFAVNSAGTVTGYAECAADSDNFHAFVRTQLRGRDRFGRPERHGFEQRLCHQ